MSRISIGTGIRVTSDSASGAIRTWFTLDFRPDAKAGDTAQAIGRATLADSADLFKWQPALNDIADREVISTASGDSVRLYQIFKGLPVDSSDIVVNIDAEGRLYSIYNEYHYDIPTSLDPKKAKVTRQQAQREAQSALADARDVKVRDQALIVYQYRHVPNSTGKPGADLTPRGHVLATFAARQARLAIDDQSRPEPGRYYIAWDIRAATSSPQGTWRVLIDAVSGAALNIIDLSQFATGNAQVFDPNPIVTSGNTSLRHTSAISVVDGQRSAVTLDNLNPPSGGNLELHGTHIHMQEEESPTVAEPTNASGTFDYSWTDNSFLDAMAYFHINRFQEYVQVNLGMASVANYSIPVDPQGLSGADNSHYAPSGNGTGYIAYGGGLQPIPASNPIPDAADAMVVLHEYGHAIQDNSNPNFDNPPSGVGEGFGDTLAAIYYDDKHANPAATRGFMMSWDSEMGTGSWLGRVYNVTWLFDGPEYANALITDNHTAGQLWCTTMFELYRKLGGDSIYPGTKQGARDLSLRLHLMANSKVPQSGATAQQMGQQIEAADSNLGGWRYANGLHKKVVYDTFRLRHLSSYSDLPVDVYINDGRQGGYGSLTGNDLFTERLWLDNWWETQDIWVKVTPYSSAAAQQAGDPGDHVEPPVGSTAYLYVRVGNKGSSPAGSGPITVQAFHADPGIGLTWPEDWIPMDTPSITIPNVLPGVPNHVVVGPFPWTPSVVGHECVLAVVQCANDHAVTQDILASDHVLDGDLVPFDNNIAQRNLNPTPAKKGGKRSFVIRNPYAERKSVELRFDSTLPAGWVWEFSPGSPVELGPQERRWVEVNINQGEGREVKDFGRPYQLSITGLIDEAVIGGMTFYLAPPSAFADGDGAEHERRHEEGRLEDFLSLEIPWKDCEVEGEIELKLRFKRK